VPSGTAAPRVAYETLVLLFRTAEALATAPTLSAFLESAMDWMLERIEPPPPWCCCATPAA
jgi:hypothetical protein